MNNLKYLVIGGDNRLAYLASLLMNDGKEVKMIFSDKFDKILKRDIMSLNWEESLQSSDILIFPLPMSKDNETLNSNYNKSISLKMIVDKILPCKIVLGGGITDKVEDLFKERNINIIDYLKREELAVYNAIPTAEGALEMAMRELPITIYNSKCLVTGFGRVSKALINILKAMGANVTVLARKYGDLAWAQIYGCDVKYITDINLAVRNKDIIFNTIPYKIINKEVLSNVRKDCLIIDLASLPGGVDFDQAEKLGLNVNWALALPGKVAPKTAGEIIKNTVDNILKEIDYI